MSGARSFVKQWIARIFFWGKNKKGRTPFVVENIHVGCQELGVAVEVECLFDEQPKIAREFDAVFLSNGDDFKESARDLRMKTCHTNESVTLHVGSRVNAWMHQATRRKKSYCPYRRIMATNSRRVCVTYGWNHLTKIYASCYTLGHDEWTHQVTSRMKSYYTYL